MVAFEPFVAASSKRQAVSASAVFLIAFLIVHVLGNLTIFSGPDTFNFYGHKLHEYRVLAAVEIYLGLGFLVHVASALLLTRKDKKLAAGWPRSQLFLSGLLLLAFLIFHVITFRFGKYYETVIDGNVVRDIAKLQIEIFSEKKTVAWYVLCSIILGFHLLWGWKKTVRKPFLGISKTFVPAALLLGQALTFCIVVGFAACPLYTHLALAN